LKNIILVFKLPT